MKIRYVITKWDRFLGQGHMLWLNRTFRGFILVSAAIIFYSRFSYGAVRDQTIAYRIGYGLWFVCWALGGGLLASRIVTGLSIYFGSGSGQVGERELRLTDEGLEEITAFGRNFHAWSGIRGLTQTGSLDIILVTAETFYSIPRRRPLIEGDLAAFLDEFRRRKGIC